MMRIHLPLVFGTNGNGIDHKTINEFGQYFSINITIVAIKLYTSRIHHRYK